MLQQQIAPATDTMGVFLKMLEYLRAFRIDAKQQLKKTRGTEQRYLDALQSTYKVLINSFYGYLGFRQARFSDFSAAAKVAAEGRSLLKKMIEWIRTQGGQPIEIDTDGIYFVPPAFAGDPSIAQFRQAFREWLPDGIEIEFDGEYPAMFSYKMKNYALLCDNDEVIIKGAALKSRGLAPFQRRLLRDIVRLKLTQQEDRLDDLKKQYEQDLLQGRWTVDMLAKTERLQDAPATYAAKVNARGRGKNAAYELALASDRQYQAGDQVSYYVTGNKKSVAVHTHARLASDWDPDNRDENVPYYLTKIEDTFKKFK
jgi:DNA polymerase elongation subunit (family B)